MTTTSYAILGLLDLRDWTAYELAQQASRSLTFTWPVSESQLYAEPKRLERDGLISIGSETAGRVRHRQVLSITDAGRAALRTWLASEPAAPVLHMEVLLRCLLATSGSQDDLLRALRSTRDASAASYEAGRALVESMVDGDQPFPERLHTNVVWMTLVADLLRLLVTWADCAIEEVNGWDDVQRGRSPEHARELLGRIPRPLPDPPT